MDCPYCSQPGAKRVFFKVRCPNAACPAYDPGVAGNRALGGAGVLRTESRPASGAAPEPARPKKIPNRGAISWVLWIAAYVLFRFGQHYESAKLPLWVLAAGVALAAWGMGRQARVDEVGRGARGDGDDEDTDLRELRRTERDEREGPFEPTGARRIEIRYKTAAGEDKTFTGDRASLRRRRAHVTLRVAPEGIRIALRADRIANRAEVEGAIPV